ncbi:MAG TPA: CRTAC1 family protein [Acidobacteriota bacterium]|nr:CRTAC1 family protein [Acidobacteriota bacterium]
MPANESGRGRSKGLPKRYRRLVGWSVLSAVALFSALVLVLKMRPEVRPYTPGERVEGISDSLSRDVPGGYPRIRFKDVSSEAGIDFRHFHGDRSVQLPEDMGSGAAWGDYDNDGDPDLYLCNTAGPLTLGESGLASSPAGNRLYRNEGDGSFTDVTAFSGTGYRGWSMGAAWGDYDSDGDLDLFLTNYGFNRLFRNDGQGAFQEVSEAAGVRGPRGFWSGASWSDYDLDGDIDLYVCGYVQYSYNQEDAGRLESQYQAQVPFTLNPSSYPPQRNLLFRNDGRGRFSEVAGQAGVANPTGRSLAAAWSDFNLDGLPDLYVANDISDNAMFQNRGDGAFEEVSHTAAVSDYRGAMGIGVGDWNNDGDQDIFISHWIAQENALFNNLRIVLGEEFDPRQMTFFDIADEVGLGQIALDYIGWGTFFFDYDNDGRQDLFLANGSTFQDDSDPPRLIGMRDLLFWNGGEERGFFEVGEVAGEWFQRKEVGRGAACADYDGDGDLDILVVNHSAPVRLLRNQGRTADQGPTNHWLAVGLRMAGGNTFGLGGRVEVVAGELRQVQEMGAQPSYLSQGPLQLHFGLGAAAVAERVTVTFPGGVRRVLENVSADRSILIREQP